MLRKANIPAEVQAALEHAIQIAHTHKISVMGFAFRADDPFILNFGNCKGMNDQSLFSQLCEMYSEGPATRATIGKLQ